jgi:hypothetical protein
MTKQDSAQLTRDFTRLVKEIAKGQHDTAAIVAAMNVQPKRKKS